MLFLWWPIHFGYKPPAFEILDGIKSADGKVGTLGTYFAKVQL